MSASAARACLLTNGDARDLKALHRNEDSQSNLELDHVNFRESGAPMNMSLSNNNEEQYPFPLKLLLFDMPSHLYSILLHGMPIKKA